MVRCTELLVGVRGGGGGQRSIIKCFNTATCVQLRYEAAKHKQSLSKQELT